ncbi:hypothetical protein D917_02113 [Trichinella nativa]|uniref:Uncharacterized protein n=1 Tax=Trichinella nativa TaxID=6335 RepID=A0A1Y3EMY6_9BILA|nr:hypothetical protein D917_02113 [Trichinella nativa]
MITILTMKLKKRTLIKFLTGLQKKTTTTIKTIIPVHKLPPPLLI